MKRNEKGITLVALVVTVIVLLILAGITLIYALGEDSIFKEAQDAKDQTQAGIGQEKEDMGDLVNLIKENKGDGSSSGNVPKIAGIVGKKQDKNTIAEDKNGNKITIPEGFKVVPNSPDGTDASEKVEYTYNGDGTPAVQDGIVIEDEEGNQFVWIPVGTIKNKKDDTRGDTTTITLGRYTFSTSSPGKPTMVANSYQYAYTNDNLTNYTNEVIIGSNKKELSTARDGVVDNTNRLNDLNATAKNLQGFVESVRTNGGYYLARYEASYGSGYNSSGSTDSAKYGNAKPLSKPSTTNTFNASTATAGSLWNNIKQLNASKVARNMYVGNKDINGNDVGVESDLVNSYAWDTAIVYITEMGNTNFANKTRGDVGSSGLTNTGSNSSDKFCNVYDMVANATEWTTEYSTSTSSSIAHPCVNRGGGYIGSDYVAGRSYRDATDSNAFFSFRLSLWIK